MMLINIMKNNKLYGAILGDLAGQPYEFPILTHFPDIKDINLHNPNSVFTDDTLMTLATAKSIMDNQSIEDAYKEVGLKYTGDHYGKDFKTWLSSPTPTVNTSWGNGCIMRISPYMYLNESKHDIKLKVIESCITSHNCPISILACNELTDLYGTKPFILKSIDRNNELLVNGKFIKFAVRADDTFNFCKDVFETNTSTHFAIKKAISCGGDTDSNASIVGELMNFTYQDLTQDDIDYVESKLDPFLLKIIRRFNQY
jgi:ADP-ribosylglycohydrolase